LFGEQPTALTGGVAYYPHFISPAEADEFFADFQKLPWKQNNLFGLSAPRMYVWMGLSYTSHHLLNKIVVTPWTAGALRVKALVEARVGCTFDSLNLNLYRDYRDSFAMHFDGEEQGLWKFPIASVSFGAERRFKWRRLNDALMTTQTLEHGSLLVMPPLFQRDFRHELAKQQKLCGPRINLTFRRISP
jgi:alkylated DNA repair dioxygenase AlkB